MWNVVLCLVNIVRGTNSYYKLQLLESDKGREYTLDKSWGRVRNHHQRSEDIGVCCPRTVRSSSVWWSMPRTHTEPHTPCVSWKSWRSSRWPDTERRRNSGFAPRPPTSVVFSHRVCSVGEPS